MPNKRLLIFFCFTIAFIWDVKAHSDMHYGKAEAIASGNGRVYVSTSNTPPAYNQMQSSHSQSFDCGKDADKDEKTYQYHAQSSDASKYDFIGWSETVGGEIMNSSTPFSVKVKATSKNKNNPTTVTRYAHFVPFFKYTADACWSVGGTASTSWTSKKVQGAEGETQNSTKVIFTAIPNEGYDFKGWASTNDAESYVATENPYEATVTNTSIGSTVDKTLCAIFAKFRIINPNTEPFISPSPLTINFGDVAYSATASYTKTFAIDAHNVGIWRNLSGLSGVFSATKSGYSNDDSQQTCTITVTLNPNELGEKNQTLHIETSRGGTIDVIVSAIISGTPTYTWNPVIWNTDGSQKATVYVDDPVLTNIVSSTSNGAWTYSITGTPSGVNNEGATAPTFTSNQVTCGQAGVYTLFVRQDAVVGGYKAGSDSRTLTINKRNNVIKVEGSPAYSTSMYYASTQNVTISSDNNGGSAPAFVVSASSDADVATYWGTGASGTITTYYTPGSASWTVTQAEDYKYQAGSATMSVNVSALLEVDCDVLPNQGEITLTTHIYSFSGEQSSAVAVPVGYRDLCFKVSHQSGANSNHMYVEYSKDGGSTWPEEEQITGWSTSWSSEKRFTIPNGVTHFRFNARVNSTLSHYFKDIHITRKTYLNASPSPITMDDIVKGQSTTKTFTVDYSCCEDEGNIVITSSDSHFTVNPSSISIPQGGKNGSQVVTVTYSSNDVGNHSATINIYNHSKSAQVTVNGKTLDKYTLDVSGDAQSAKVGQTIDAGYVFSYVNTSVTPSKPVDGDVEGFDSSLAGNHFYFTISHDLTGNATTTGSPDGTKVVSYNPATNEITALNAGVATITFHETGSALVYSSTDVSFVVNVSKNVPEFTWNYGKDNGKNTANTEVYFNHNATHNNIYSNFVVSNSTYNNTGCVLSTISSSNPEVATVAQGTEQYQVDLSTYNDYTYKPTYSAQSTDITITQAENYYWESKTETKSVTPSVASNHVELTINNQAVYDAVFYAKSPDVNQYNASENAIRLGVFNGFNWDDKTTDIHFEGIPESVSFQAYTTGGATGVDFRIYESPDGSNWGTHIWKGEKIDQTVTNLHLQPTTRYLRLYYTGNFDGFFKNVKITELHQFEVTPMAIDFGVLPITAGTPTEDFVFYHANAGYDVEVSLDDAIYNDPEKGQDYDHCLNGNFVVMAGETPIDEVNGTGGDRMGQANLRIKFTGVEEGKYAGYIYIRDKIGNEAKVWVTGIRVNNSQMPTFEWNPNGQRYLEGSIIPDILLTNSSGAITYTTITNPDAAYVDAEGALHVIQPNKTVTIRVSQAEVQGEWFSLTQDFTFTTLARSLFDLPLALTDSVYNGSQVNSRYGHEWNESASEGDGVRLGPSVGAFGWFDKAAYDWSEKYITIFFNGSPDMLYFDYRTNHSDATGTNWTVEESEDGRMWNRVWNDTYSGSQSLRHAAISISHNARYIRVIYPGNYAGHVKNLYITAYEGVRYLRNCDGHRYLSRGGDDNRQAVLDDFGLGVHHYRITKDNVEIIDLYRYTDNERYLHKDNASITTIGEGEDADLNHWITTSKSDTSFVIQDKANEQYLKMNNDGTLSFDYSESSATCFIYESPSKHRKWLNQMLEAQAIDAANEFNVDVADMARLTEELDNNDYTRTPISITPSHNTVMNVSAVREVYESEVLGNEVSGMCGVVSDVEPGLYRLRLKALNRESFNDIAYKNYIAGIDNSVAYIVLNGKKTPIMSVYTTPENSDYSTTGYLADYRPNEIENVYYPNSIYAAAVAFQHPDNQTRYINEVYAFVKPDEGKTTGTITYGLYCPSNAGYGNWLCYEGYTLERFERKEYIFTNQNGNHKWSDPGNWDKGDGKTGIPLIVHNVLLQAAAEVDIPGAAAYSMEYDQNYQASSLTILPEGGLTIGMGGFVGSTTPSKLVLKANDDKNDPNAGKTGVLRIHPKAEAPNATVQFYSVIANPEDNEDWDWQYIGSPVTKETVDFNERLFYNCWLYQHNTKTNEWSNAGNWNKMEPFLGYSFTRNDGQTGSYGTRPSTGPLFAFVGQLNSPSAKELTLQRSGDKNENHFANSWTAPIHISKLTDKELDSTVVDKTIYYYPAKGGNVKATPPYSAKYTDEDVIPAMQGFFVLAKKDGAKLILDYEKLVWDVNTINNEPLKAPSLSRGGDNEELLSRVRIDMISSDSIPDNLYLIEKEGEGFSREFTEGYDAPKYFVDGLPCIYTYETSGKHLSVSATDNVVGTYLAINTNASQNYTLTFSKVIGEGLGLRDLVTNTIVPITEGMQYAFTAPANSSPMLRFVVVEHEETPQWNNNNGTSLEDLGGEFKIWQSGEILSVIGSGSHASLRLYDAAGKLILSEFFNEATAINLNALPTGVYMVQVNDKTEKVLR